MTSARQLLSIVVAGFILLITFLAPITGASDEILAARIPTTTTPTPTPIAPGTVLYDDFQVPMVYVPAGRFKMGITRETAAEMCAEYFKEMTQDNCAENMFWGSSTSGEVEVKGFWIDLYEVTIEQYKACQDERGDRACAETYMDKQLTRDSHQPQSMVNWYDAESFCNRRDARLPSEAEWEYAARGPDNLLFPWGNSFIRENVVPSGEFYPTDSTYPVGSLTGNKSWIGVYDLAGNVEEWVEDRYDTPPPYWVDLQGPVYDTFRIGRGGAWGDYDFGFFTFRQYPASPFSRSDRRGFRCVRSATSPDW
jgi:formylglycine-generating enzyme required for sulfatase activity